MALASGLFAATTSPLPALATGPAPGIISTVAGGGLGEGKALTIGQNTAGGLAMFGSTLYVGDPLRDVVRAVNLSTSDERVVAGNGQPGSTGDGGPATSAAIGAMSALAVNPSGDLYIADTTTQSSVTTTIIRRVDHLTGNISTVGGGGSSFADGVTATATSISDVSGMSTNTAGDLYIADTLNARVRKVTFGMATILGGIDEQRNVFRATISHD